MIIRMGRCGKDVEAALCRHLAVPLGAGSPLQHQIDLLPDESSQCLPSWSNASRRLMALNDAPYRHERQVILEGGSRSEHIQIVNTGGYQGFCG